MQDVNRGEVAPWATCGHHEGQSKAWPAVAGTWTGMGVDAAWCTHVRTRFFSRRQEERAMRKAHPLFHGKRRDGAHAELWLDSNLFVTLPRAIKRFDSSSLGTLPYSIRTDATDARIGCPSPVAS